MSQVSSRRKLTWGVNSLHRYRCTDGEVRPSPVILARAVCNIAPVFTAGGIRGHRYRIAGEQQLC